MIYWLGICIGLSGLLESVAYIQQIRKTYQTQKSKDVSSSSYFAKLGKYCFGIAALSLSNNWVGLGLELWAFLLCIITTIFIIKNKPKGWSWWR